MKLVITSKEIKMARIVVLIFVTAACTIVVSHYCSCNLTDHRTLHNKARFCVLPKHK